MCMPSSLVTLAGPGRLAPRREGVAADGRGGWVRGCAHANRILRLRWRGAWLRGARGCGGAARQPSVRLWNPIRAGSRRSAARGASLNTHIFSGHFQSRLRCSALCSLWSFAVQSVWVVPDRRQRVRVPCHHDSDTGCSFLFCVISSYRELSMSLICYIGM